MAAPSEPITLDYLGRMFARFADDLADLKSQFIVQTAILQRLDAGQNALEAGQRSLATEIHEVHTRLGRMDRRLRALEDRLDPATAP
jgi:hypothetical protein